MPVPASTATDNPIAEPAERAARTTTGQTSPVRTATARITREAPDCPHGPELLARAQLFDELSPKVRARFAALATLKTYPRDKLLFDQHQAGDALYVVVSGRVEISFIGMSGRKLVLNYMGPGDVFGEIALLDGGPRTASATTVEPSELYRIARTDALDLIASDREVAVELIHVLCQRLRWVNAQFEDRALLPIPARTAKKLLMLVERLGVRDGRLALSQSDLADMVGATRESINRTLAHWRARGWIALARGQITVRDRKALATLVDEAMFAPRN